MGLLGRADLDRVGDFDRIDAPGRDRIICDLRRGRRGDRRKRAASRIAAGRADREKDDRGGGHPGPTPAVAPCRADRADPQPRRNGLRLFCCEPRPQGFAQRAIRFDLRRDVGIFTQHRFHDATPLRGQPVVDEGVDVVLADRGKGGAHLILRRCDVRPVSRVLRRRSRARDRRDMIVPIGTPRTFAASS